MHLYAALGAALWVTTGLYEIATLVREHHPEARLGNEKPALLQLLSSVQILPSLEKLVTVQKLPTVEPRADIKKKNMVYFANWDIYGRNYRAKDIPAEKVTHILYSFANLQPDGTVIPGGGDADTVAHDPADASYPGPGNNADGCVRELFALKKAHRHVKVLLSIGGWSWSHNFASAAGSAENRGRFAKTAVELLADWGLDGIDIDWEYPKNEAESENMLQLLIQLREALDLHAADHAPGYRFLLTMAVGAGPEHYNIMSKHLGRMGLQVDAMNLMAYDFTGSWDAKSGHQANLRASKANPDSTPFSAERAVADYLALGVAPDRMVLGMPLYGRSFENTDGPGRPFAGTGPGSYEQGIWDYKALPLPGAVETVDAETGAAYSYNAAAREMVSYDTVETVAQKVAYIKDLALGGAMFWEVSGDRAGELSLVAASADKLDGLDRTENLLKYPTSKYDNIREGN
ncbi:hypothetical protein RB594_006812 [Gaeumannomyces avenae]